jgi:hypothetical protein
MSRGFVPLIVAASLSLLFARGQTNQNSASQNSSDKPYVIEYYYKVKWGHADEFIALFRKNHYPVLKREIDIGRILQVTAVTPRYHMPEQEHWDYRTTIVFRNAAAANADIDEAQIQRQLFPDQQTFKREEQRRFEILDAHWDVPVKDVDVSSR